MTMIDGGLAKLFGAAMAGLYVPATLHRVTWTRARGGSTSETVEDMPCRAQLDAATEAMRASSGATARDVRLLVLAASLSGGVTSDDRISIGSETYSIAGVTRDPAGATYELQGQRI